ncbi:hypothetical protein [Actinoplanes sp. NPDC020271]|uniref:hypothetical protein n=1 Tax=Actinoplanes sp. NPDC020271 TaxID=3363896 RepID=UPI00379AE899
MLFRRTGEISATILHRANEPVPSPSLDTLAAEVADAPGYAELWHTVQHEVDGLLREELTDAEDHPPVPSAKDAAAWHVSWLFFALRASLPSTKPVEAFMTAASVATTALVTCAVLRTAYPAVWDELEELHLTPFELAGFLFGVVGLNSRRDGD